MPEIPGENDGLELDEDRSFQERFWTVERYAWAVFAAIIVAALAGLSGGGGPLSRASRAIGEAGVDYPAISRWTTSATFAVRLPHSGKLSIVLGPRFLESFEIESVQPEPVEATTAPDGLRLAFQVDGDGAAPIAIRAQALKVGRIDYDVSIEGAGTASLSTLIVP